MLVEDRALILQAYPYGETSRILKLLCESHGLRTVIAKGARRPKSRFGGLLEPFTEGRAQFRLKEGREMHPLAGFELVRGRQGIGRSLVGFAGASLLSELTLRFATAEGDPDLYRRLAGCLDALVGAAGEDDAAALALGGAWQLIALLGFEPRLDACVRCDREIGPAEATRFDMDAGGVACLHCRPSGRVVDAGTRRDVASMCAGGGGEGAGDWGLHRALLRAFVAAHLSQEYPLRSMELFGGMLPRGPGGPRPRSDESREFP